MKRLSYITGFIVALCVFCSCNDWIGNTEPRSETPEHQMFGSEKGFEAALTGAYIMMANTNLYAEKATMYIPEFLIRNWMGPSGASGLDNKLNEYENGNYRDDDDVRGEINAMWTQYYKVIAQLNSLITNIENTDVNFTGYAKEMIYGEALGLRAFLHLDLLRFFGPIPTTDYANPEQVYLPYVTKITNDFNELAPIPLGVLGEGLYSESPTTYIGKLEKDLMKAQELLADPVDPIFHYTQEGQSGGRDEKLEPSNPYEGVRKRRFNYWAVRATEARLKSWFGEKVEAADIALEIINARGFNGSVMFPLATETDLVGVGINFTMNREHIFGIINPDLYKRIQDRYRGELVEIVAGSGITNRERPKYAQSTARIRNLYVDFFPGDDWRGSEREYWETKTNDPDILVYRKYVNNVYDNDKAQANRVPVIRIAEMYLLYFEGRGTQTPTGFRLLTDYMDARGIVNGKNQMRDAMIADLDGQIAKEYRKEFWGEGQTWFYFKRRGFTELKWPNSDEAPRKISNPAAFWSLEIPPSGYTDFYKNMYPGLYPDE